MNRKPVLPPMKLRRIDRWGVIRVEFWVQCYCCADAVSGPASGKRAATFLEDHQQWRKVRGK